MAVAAGTGMSVGISLSDATITSTTQASVDAAVLTALGNDVFVDATSVSTLDPENLGAAVDISAGIAGIHSQATIAGATRAFADGATIVKADSLELAATDTNTASPRSLVVGVGVFSVGVAGALSTTNITRTTEAFIGDDSQISIGSGPVNLTAKSTSDADGETTGVGAGISIGVSLLKVDVTVDNTTRAYVGDGATVDAGQLSLLAEADNTATAPTLAVGLGLLGGALIDVSATDSSTVDAYVGPEIGTASTGTPTTVTISGGGVDVRAHATSLVDTDSDVLGLGLLAGGALTQAISNASPTVRAYMGDDATVTADGDVMIEAAAQVEGTTDATGFSAGGGFSVAGAEVETNVNPIIRSFTVGGGAISANNVTLTSRHNVDEFGNALSLTPAFGETTLGSASLGVGVAGAIVTVENSPTIETKVGSGTTINATDAVSLASQSFQLADVDGFTAAGGLVAGIGITLPDSFARGTVSTHVDGVIESANTVSIVSDVDTRSKTQGLGAAFGFVGVTLAFVDARTSPDIDTFVGSSGRITATGDVTVESLVQSRSEASTKAIAGGIGAGLRVDTTATAQPQIDTYLANGGNITSSGGNVTLNTAHNFVDPDFIGGNVVRAAIESTSIGGLAVAEGNVTANALADVDTRTEAGSSIEALSGVVRLEARSGNFADATIENDTDGAITVSFLNPTANANGITKAQLLGNVGSTQTITNVFGESVKVGTPGAVDVSVIAQAADRSTADFDNSADGAVTIDDPSTGPSHDQADHRGERGQLRRHGRRQWELERRSHLQHRRRRDRQVLRLRRVEYL